MKGRGTIALVCAIMGLAVAAPAAVAATIRVNDNALPAACVGAFPTIQQGVNAASPGDTIIVCQGYYNESVTVNTANLTIRGNSLPPDLGTCNATRTAVNSLAFPNRPYVVVRGNIGDAFYVNADNVSLSKFVIQGPTGGNNAGVYLNPGFSGYTFMSNLVQDNTFGLYLNASGATQTVVQQNCFRQNNDAGSASGNAIYSDQGLANALVQSNRSFGHSSSGGVFTGTPGPDTLTIQSNITANDGEGYSLYRSTNSKVVGNIVSGTSFHALCLLQNTGLQILANIFKGTGYGMRFAGCGETGTASTGLTISGNIVTTTNNAFWVAQGNKLKNSTVSGNIFKSTAANGMYVQGATNNGGNVFSGNIGTGATGFYGCRDNTTGTGTGGTANTWGNSNIGKPHNLPTAICFPNI